MNLSECAKVNILPTVDIGGTNGAAVDATYWGAWHDVSGFEKIYGKAMIGATWNAADDLDECRLQQATSSAGAGAKDLTTDASGGNYDTDNPVDAAGNTVVLEANADQLDVDGGFRYVRLYVAEGGNTGTDEVAGVLILHCPKHAYSQREGAASTGVTAYGRPS